MIGAHINQDILERLKTIPIDGGLVGMSWAAEAAAEITRLREEVRTLRQWKYSDRQYEQGYSDAQENIRRALGIEEI